MMAFAGFDSLGYPGDSAMFWLKANSNFSFVGFYLAPAPSHQGSAWMDRRGTLSSQGWGLLPIYVGQQEDDQPGHHELTPEQGDKDGRNATDLMRRAGFSANSVTYLDVEEGGPASARTLAYFGAWVDALVSLGLYSPGVYCSHTTAASLLTSRPKVFVWTWNLKDLRPTPPNFPANDPAGSGVTQAIAWQYAQNTTIAFDGAAIPPLVVDLDCASVADPSQPILFTPTFVAEK